MELSKEAKVQIGTQIAENDNYMLCVCELAGVDLPCYGLINKRWGVVEMSTSVLANARKFLEMLDKWEKTPPDDETAAGLPDFGPDVMQ